MMGFQMFLVSLLFELLFAESGGDKRLVLHSGDDIASEFLALRQEIQALKASHSLEIQALKSEIEKLERDQGSTYVRWGRTTCDGNATEKVYSGFTSGSPYDIAGGAASYICLPEHPTWAQYLDGIQDDGGYVSGTEYKTYGISPFPHNMLHQDAPCVVCRTPRQTTITIPGRTSCVPGWTMEYTGYLMTGHITHKSATDYACVDADPEAVYHGEAELAGKLFYFAEVKCGSLPCQEYPNGRELACVVDPLLAMMGNVWFFTATATLPRSSRRSDRKYKR